MVVTLNIGDYDGLCDVGTMGRDGFHLAVEIYFKRQSGSIKNRAAIAAIAKVTLYLAGNFGCEPTL